jgi:cytochrome c oxidase subunit 2
MCGRGLLITALGLIVIGIVGLIVLASGALPITRVANTPVARGEWIYRTGTEPTTGQPIPYVGGMMMRMSCANCHGVDGNGLRTPMFISPNITYRNLTDPAGMLEPDGTRGPTYTDALIRRAITQGIDAEGEPLAWPMPRWRMTNQELDDLLTYLKTLP